MSRRTCLALALFAGVSAIGFAMLRIWPMDSQRYLVASASTEVLDRDGQMLCPFLNRQDQWLFARDLDEISPFLIQATIAAEDERFRRHPGVDPLAMLRAAAQNVWRGRIVSGGSTLTMQVVKQAEASPRTLPGKLRQTLQALRLEQHATKDDILRAYLNRAPYGLNVLGCEAAARRYFGKAARELTLAEAALLAALPKAPTTLMPLDHPGNAQARRDYVLRRMRDAGYISDRECMEAQSVPLGTAWHEFPTYSRHLAIALARGRLPGSRMATTLDLAVQRDAERLVTEALKRQDGEITNAALLVVDVTAAAILARVGSAAFFETPGGGQVDVCRAPRSPGSALKPFTYALAIQMNRLYPCEMLCDGALDYGLYSPENYDRQEHGTISAADALRSSLNVPAVTVLERTTPRALHALLSGLGLTTLTRAPEEYGLGLTLGDCEVRLDQLAGAYCALAEGGSYRPLTVVKDAPPSTERRVFSPGACESLFRMLEQSLAGAWRDGTVDAGRTPPRVCWKTGTSTGFHDAWAFVFNRQYLVAVWMGNNDGRPSRQLVGADAALPLAARAFALLEPGNTPAWPEGKSLRAVRVCAVSGLPASPWCRDKTTALVPREQYLTRRCDMHYPADENDEGGGRALCERWPGSVNGWDLARIDAPMAASTGDRSRHAQTTLRIVQPADRAEFVLTGQPKGDRIRLATSLDTTAALHWFLDNHYLGISTPSSPMQVALEPGTHKLVCLGDSPAAPEQVATFRVVEAGTPRFRVQ